MTICLPSWMCLEERTLIQLHRPESDSASESLSGPWWWWWWCKGVVGGRRWCEAWWEMPLADADPPPIEIRWSPLLFLDLRSGSMGGAWCEWGTGDRLLRMPPPPPRVPLAVFTDSADLSRASEGLVESPPFADGGRESLSFEHWVVEVVEGEFMFWLPAGVRTPFGGTKGELARDRRPREPLPSSPPPPPPIPPPPICLPPTTIFEAAGERKVSEDSSLRRLRLSVFKSGPSKMDTGSRCQS